MKIELNIDDRIVGVVRFFLGKQSLIVGFILVAAISSLITYAAVVKPHTFTSGTVIRSDHVNENFDELYQYVNTLVPVGTIVAWHKSKTGTPAIPNGWVECNGQVINDAASPYNGTNAPDLNNDVGSIGDGGRFLRGNATSGTFQADELKAHNHTMHYGDYDFKYDNPSRTWAIRTGAGSYQTDNAGGTETRPVNMSVVWIMRIK
ncbi:MAG TPA: hypothetical protein PKM65_04125 [Spirochaetota bacterium]|nr:hypothetical protein [Spirochaetota bacterium]HNT10730.1 hypothetical protein [Spirochaetota bacterium]